MNSPTQIHRVFRPEELHLVAELAESIWLKHYEPLIGAAQVMYMLDKFQSVPALQVSLSQGHELYLADVEDTPVGYAMLIPDETKKALMVSKLYVSQRARGKGVGSALLELAHERAQRFGCSGVWLTVNRNNRNSIAWYERKGFVITNEITTSIGQGYVMDDYRMECSLLK